MNHERDARNDIGSTCIHWFGRGTKDINDIGNSERVFMSGMCVNRYDCYSCDNLDHCWLISDEQRQYYQAEKSMIEEANL